MTNEVIPALCAVGLCSLIPLLILAAVLFDLVIRRRFGGQ